MPTEFRWVTPKRDHGGRESSTEGLREQAELGESIAAFCYDCERERCGALGVEGDGDITWRCSECDGLQNLSWLDPY